VHPVTLHHLATCQAVVLRSIIKVTFDLHNFSFVLSLSHVWVTNLYPQHGDTTHMIHSCLPYTMIFHSKWVTNVTAHKVEALFSHVILLIQEASRDRQNFINEAYFMRSTFTIWSFVSASAGSGIWDLNHKI